jgi:hypothetical protein
MSGLTPNLDIALSFIIKNVRGLTTKQLELYENVYPTDYNTICLSETWPNDLCYDHNLFPDCCTVLRSDRASVNKTRGRGVLIVLVSRVCSCKRRYGFRIL